MILLAAEQVSHNITPDEQIVLVMYVIFVGLLSVLIAMG